MFWYEGYNFVKVKCVKLKSLRSSTLSCISLDLFHKLDKIILMKRAFLLLIILVFYTSVVLAQTTPQDRRIEQEKRDSLSVTEELRYEKKEPSPQPSTSIDQDYFKELLEKKNALFSDACKTISILTGIIDQCPDFKSQLDFLKQNNIIPRKVAYDLIPNQPLRKGLAAYMYCRALKIKGGLWMRLFGVNQRYAFKELLYMGMMLPGHEKDIVTGKELILLLTEAANYLTQE